MKKIMLMLCCMLLLSACNNQKQSISEDTPDDVTIATEEVSENDESITAEIDEIAVEEPEYIPDHKTREDFEYSYEKALWIIVDSFDAYVTDACVDERPGMLASGWDQFVELGIPTNALEIFTKGVSEIATDLGSNTKYVVSDYDTYSDMIATGSVSIDAIRSSLSVFTDEVLALTDNELEYFQVTAEEIDALQSLNRDVQNGTIDLEDWFAPTKHYINIAFEGSYEILDEMVNELSITADNISVDYIIEVTISDYSGNTIYQCTLYPQAYVLPVYYSNKYDAHLNGWYAELSDPSCDVQQEINAQITKLLNDEESFKFIDSEIHPYDTLGDLSLLTNALLSEDSTYIGYNIPKSTFELNDAFVVTNFSAKNPFNATMKYEVFSVVRHRTGDVSLISIK